MAEAAEAMGLGRDSAGLYDPNAGMSAGEASIKPPAGPARPLSPANEDRGAGAAGPATAAPPQRGGSVKDQVRQEWLNAGYSPAAVDGILRRVQVESGFDPRAMGDVDKSGQPTSFGLYQHHADRAVRLRQFAEKTGASPSDPLVQTKFAISEMNGGDPLAAKARDQLMRSSDPGQAYGLFTRSFERPKNAPGSDETNLHAVATGTFNEGAQTLVGQWKTDVEKRGKEYDAALAESKTLHSAARSMTEKWMTESDKPPQNMHQAWSQWAGVAGAIALIGGMFGRNATASINAAGEMLQAANSADSHAYDKAYQQWKDHLDRGIKLTELLDKDARQIVDDARKSYDQKVSELQVLSTSYQLQQMLDPKSVENLTKNLALQKQSADVIRAQNTDSDVRLSAADKDAAWLKEHPEADGKVPATVHSSNVGEAERERSGTANNAALAQKLSVAGPLEAKFIADGMSQAEAHAKAYREAGITPGGGAPTQSKGREADLQGAIDADVAKFKADNPGATQEQINDARYKARLTHEKEVGAAVHQPRSAGAMGLQKFLEENPGATADQIQTFAAKGAEKASEGRSVGTRSASLEMAANTAQALIPLLKQTSEKIDRTEFPTVNSILLAAEKGTGNTDVVRYSEMLNSLKYAYARALNPTGQARQGDLARFDEILALAWSKGQINAALDQMQQTINVEKKAIAETREEVHSGGVREPAAKGGGGKYSVGQVIEHGGKKYRVTGGDLNDPDVEEVK